MIAKFCVVVVVLLLAGGAAEAMDREDFLLMYDDGRGAYAKGWLTGIGTYLNNTFDCPSETTPRQHAEATMRLLKKNPKMTPLDAAILAFAALTDCERALAICRGPR